MSSVPLEHVLERLEEEHGHEDVDPQKPTDAMVKAEKAFLDAVFSEYIVRQYDAIRDTRMEVNLRQWVVQHPRAVYDKEGRYTSTEVM